MVSTVTGRYVTSAATTLKATAASSATETTDVSAAAYWARQVRAPVRLDLALATLAQDFPRALVVEVGPSAGLAGLIARSVSEAAAAAAAALEGSVGGLVAEGREAAAAAAAALSPTTASDAAGIVRTAAPVDWVAVPALRPTKQASAAASAAAPAGGDAAAVAAALDPRGECAAFLRCLGHLFVHCGVVPRLRAPRGSASLPPYPFALHVRRPKVPDTSKASRAATAFLVPMAASSRGDLVTSAAAATATATSATPATSAAATAVATTAAAETATATAAAALSASTAAWAARGGVPAAEALHAVAWEEVPGGVAPASLSAGKVLPVLLLEAATGGDGGDGDGGGNGGGSGSGDNNGGGCGGRKTHRAVAFLEATGLCALAPRFRLVSLSAAAAEAQRYGALVVVAGRAARQARGKVSAGLLNDDGRRDGNNGGHDDDNDDDDGGGGGGGGEGEGDGDGEATAVASLLARLVVLLQDLGDASVDLHCLMGGEPRYAGLRGCLRVARKEMPNLRLRAVTLFSGGNGGDCGGGEAQGRLAPALLAALPLECFVDANGRVFVPRVRCLAAGNSPAPVRTMSTLATSTAARATTAVVSGGLRGLGLRVAYHLLATKAASRVVLLGRTLPKPSADDNSSGGGEAALLKAVLALGAVAVRCDVSHWSDVASVAASDAADGAAGGVTGGAAGDAGDGGWGAVGLVVHCAGVVADELIRSLGAPPKRPAATAAAGTATNTSTSTPPAAGLEPERTRVQRVEDAVAQVLAPKVAGTAHLRRRWPEATLLCFSSSSAALGPAGQATYAAANAFVDEFVARAEQQRATRKTTRRRGSSGKVGALEAGAEAAPGAALGAAQSVQWGGWGGAGMAVDLGIAPLKGERFFSVGAGLEVLDLALAAAALRGCCSRAAAAGEAAAASDGGEDRAPPPLGPSRFAMRRALFGATSTTDAVADGTGASSSGSFAPLLPPVVLALDVHWPAYATNHAVAAAPDSGCSLLACVRHAAPPSPFLPSSSSSSSTSLHEGSADVTRTAAGLRTGGSGGFSLRGAGPVRFELAFGPGAPRLRSAAAMDEAAGPEVGFEATGGADLCGDLCDDPWGEAPELQHVVDGAPILPGSAYLCWALRALECEASRASSLTAAARVRATATEAASGAALRLSAVRFVKPLDLRGLRRCVLELTPDVHGGGSGGSGGGGGSGTGACGAIKVTCDGETYATMRYKLGAPTQLDDESASDDDEDTDDEDDVDGIGAKGGGAQGVAGSWRSLEGSPYGEAGAFGAAGFGYGRPFQQLRGVRLKRGRDATATKKEARAAATAELVLPGVRVLVPGAASAAAATTTAAGAEATVVTGAVAARPVLTFGTVDSALQLASLVDGGVMGVPSRAQAVTWWPAGRPRKAKLNAARARAATPSAVALDAETDDHHRSLSATLTATARRCAQLPGDRLPSFDVHVASCRRDSLSGRRRIFLKVGRLELFPTDPTAAAAALSGSDATAGASEGGPFAFAVPAARVAASALEGTLLPEAVVTVRITPSCGLGWSSGEEVDAGRRCVSSHQPLEHLALVRAMAQRRPIEAVRIIVEPRGLDAARAVPKNPRWFMLEEAARVVAAGVREWGLAATVQWATVKPRAGVPTEEAPTEMPTATGEGSIVAIDLDVADALEAVEAAECTAEEEVPWDAPFKAFVDASGKDIERGVWFERVPRAGGGAGGAIEGARGTGRKRSGPDAKAVVDSGCDRPAAAAALPPLGRGQVEILTSAWALNFRDVLVASGAIPTTTAGSSLGLGGECGGVVTRVGAGVRRVAAGDVVVAVPPDGLGSFLVTDEEWVSPPLGPEWARRLSTPLVGDTATAPAAANASAGGSAALSPAALVDAGVADTMAYATAWLALISGSGRVHPGRGEVVLLHAAAGGVGLAALHLLQSRFVNDDGSGGAGAGGGGRVVVYGTASTPEKRALLLRLGCAGAFDSRDPFAFCLGVRRAERSRLARAAAQLADAASAAASSAQGAVAAARAQAALARAAAKKGRAPTDDEAVLAASAASAWAEAQRQVAAARAAAKCAAAAAARAEEAAASATAFAMQARAASAGSGGGVAGDDAGGSGASEGSSSGGGSGGGVGGDGVVDVVLGAVTGAAFDASVGLLRPFGRFVELGKRLGYEGGHMRLAPFLEGLTYSAAHLDVLMLRDKARAADLFQQVWAALPELPALPVTAFAMRDVNAALAHLRRGVHVGKVLLLSGPGHDLDGSCALKDGSSPERTGAVPVIASLAAAAEAHAARRLALCDGGGGSGGGSGGKSAGGAKQQKRRQQRLAGAAEAPFLTVLGPAGDPVTAALRSLGTASLPPVTLTATAAPASGAISAAASTAAGAAAPPSSATLERLLDALGRDLDGLSSASGDGEVKGGAQEEGGIGSDSGNGGDGDDESDGVVRLRVGVLPDLEGASIAAHHDALGTAGAPDLDLMVVGSAAAAAWALAAGVPVVVEALAAVPGAITPRLLGRSPARPLPLAVSAAAAAAVLPEAVTWGQLCTGLLSGGGAGLRQLLEAAAWASRQGAGAAATFSGSCSTAGAPTAFANPFVGSVHVILGAQNSALAHSGGAAQGLASSLAAGVGGGPAVFDGAAFEAWLVGAIADLTGTAQGGGGGGSGADRHAGLDALGVDSLAQIGLARRVGVRLGLSGFGVGDLLAYPSVAGLVAFAEALHAPATPAPQQPAHPHPSSAPPLAPSSLRLGGERAAADSSAPAPAHALAAKATPASPTQEPPLWAPAPPPATTLRPRVLCLHGFRSSGDILRVALGPLLVAAGCARPAAPTASAPFSGAATSAAAPATATATFDFEFVDAPHAATGPSEPGIPPEMPTFEWWSTTPDHDAAAGEGAVDSLLAVTRSASSSYNHGWKGFGPARRFSASRAAVLAAAAAPGKGPVVGLLGFSQGGAMALALAGDPTNPLPRLGFVACFSSVTPRDVTRNATGDSEGGGGEDGGLPGLWPPPSGLGRGSLAALASFHAFDPDEDHAHLCAEAVGLFAHRGAPGAANLGEAGGARRVEVAHGLGHAIPRSGPGLTAVARAFREFLQAAASEQRG